MKFRNFYSFMLELMVSALLSVFSLSAYAQTEKYLPSKINIVGYSEVKFLYDDSYRISQIIWNDEDYQGDIPYMELAYDESGKISFYIHSYYDSYEQQMIRSKYDVSYGLDGLVTIKEEGDDMNVQQIEINDEGKLLRGGHSNDVYEYDSKGNTKKIDGFSTEEFTYDDKNGIYKNVNTPKWFMTYVFLDDDLLSMNWLNNIIQCIYSYTGGSSVETYVYDYNQDGYPVKMTLNEDGGGSSVYEIEYQQGVDTSLNMVDNDSVGINIYYNPTNEVLDIIANSTIISSGLFMLNGNNIRQFGQETHLSLTGVPTGIYLLNVNFIDGSLKTLKIIKK